jgi:hypothetical protein
MKDLFELRGGAMEESAAENSDGQEAPEHGKRLITFAALPFPIHIAH